MFNKEEILDKYKDAIYSRALHFYRANPRFDFNDLVSEARVATLNAIKNYSESKKTKFLTYLIYSIDMELKKFLWKNSHSVHVSEWNARKNTDSVKAIVEIPFDTAKKNEDSSENYSASYTIASGIAPSPADIVEKADTIKVLMDEIGKLPAKESMVIKSRFFDDKTQVEVAKELNTTKQMVHNLEKSGLKKLNKRLKMKLGD